MTLYTSATLDASPHPNETLARLSDALEGRRVGADRRVIAAQDSRNPDEGLALLDAYVSIAESAVRQAILDTVLAIAGADPYRRAQSRKLMTGKPASRRPTASDSGDP